MLMLTTTSFSIDIQKIRTILQVLIFFFSNWLRLVETLRTSSEQYEDYEFDDLAATVRLYEPSLAFSFDNL